MDEAGCYLHTRDNLYIGNIWLGSVKLCKNFALHEKDCILCIKQANKGFPKDLVELTMNNWPGGTSLVMKTMKKKNVVLLSIGYKYNSTIILCLLP